MLGQNRVYKLQRRILNLQQSSDLFFLFHMLQNIENCAIFEGFISEIVIQDTLFLLFEAFLWTQSKY